MPRLVALSLTLPRLEEADLQALAALSGLTHLDLRSSHTAQQEETTLREPVGMPPLVHLSPLANLRALELEHVSPGEKWCGLVQPVYSGDQQDAPAC
jgi:hypothetical protein